jgi:hypothetical protein
MIKVTNFANPLALFVGTDELFVSHFSCSKHKIKIRRSCLFLSTYVIAERRLCSRFDGKIALDFGPGSRILRQANLHRFVFAGPRSNHETHASFTVAHAKYRWWITVPVVSPANGTHHSIVNDRRGSLYWS